MSDVTVIGLGEMGSALVNALMTAGKTVTVWNRNPERARPLVDRGAILAVTPPDAFAASPIIIICVTDYTATYEILEINGALDALNGRIIVHLTSGIPKQARRLDKLLSANCVRYLDGAIAAWPSQIGTTDATILLSGEHQVYAEAEPLLEHLAGNLGLVGAEIGGALTLLNATLSYLAAHWIGFAHAAAICEAEGVDVGAFAGMLAELAPSLGNDIRHMGERISTNVFGDPDSVLATASVDVSRLVELSSDLSIGSDWPRFATSIFQRALDAGLGNKDTCAIVTVMRNTR